MNQAKMRVAQVDSRHVVSANDIQRRLSLSGDAVSKLVAVLTAVDDSRFEKRDADVVTLSILGLDLARSLAKDIVETEAIANGLAVDMGAAHKPSSRPEGEGKRPPSIDVSVPTMCDWADSLASIAQLMDEVKEGLVDNLEFRKVEHLFNGAVALLDDVQLSVFSFEPHDLMKTLKVAA